MAGDTGRDILPFRAALIAYPTLGKVLFGTIPKFILLISENFALAIRVFTERPHTKAQRHKDAEGK
jgi:hypothetical protein